MKLAYLIFFSYLSLLGTLQARSEMSEQNMVFRQIAMSLQLSNADRISGFPNRFDEVESIKRMIKESPYLLRYFNLLSIVPNTPLVEGQIGMTLGVKKYKLFAMSRVPCFDEILSQNGVSKVHGGRFLFLNNMEDHELHPKWIPEPEVQFILKQLDGFDPEKQPLAFQDLISANERIPPIQSGTHQTRIDTDTIQSASSDANPNPKEPSQKTVVLSTESNLTRWLAGLVVMLLGYLGLRYFRNTNND